MLNFFNLFYLSSFVDQTTAVSTIFKCNSCDKEYYRKNSFYCHIKYMCGKEPKCLWPVKNYTYRGEIQHHVKQHLQYFHKFTTLTICKFKINKID